MTTPRLIAFEGLDGSGKSTVIVKIAEALRASGTPVFLPRVGKEHSSRPVRMIRRLTRDRRNLTLGGRAELALYCAREAQVLDEQVRPALARGETVLLDRSLLTPEVLGRYGRRLPEATCRAMVEAAAAGLHPDLTIILDVDPRTSRIRKRLAKAIDPGPPDPGRKGLAGSAMKARMREGYLELAAERGYPVLHTERADPSEVARRVLAVVTQGAPPESLESAEDATPRWRVPEGTSFADAIADLPERLALYFTRGLAVGRPIRAAAATRDPELVAWALDPLDPLRHDLAWVAPHRALGGMAGQPLDPAGDLRARLLREHPEAALRGLRRVAGPEADEVRAQAAELAPGALVASLAGREDERAWAWRDAHWREAQAFEQAASLVRCGSEAAWARRERLLARDPIMGLRSLKGLWDDRAMDVLEAFADLAPKAVLAALAGAATPRAHALRTRLVGTGREVIDSLGLAADGPAMALRRAHLSEWPATVFGSTLGLPSGPDVDDLRARCEAAGRGDLHLLRRLEAARTWNQRPRWARRLGETMP